MEKLNLLLENTVSVCLEALPFLAIGFFVAGLLKAFVPHSFIAKNLGKDNLISPIKATILGAPIPLCSCSVIPVAMGLRREGVGKGSLTSFLISAPETGVDSLSISYAMLGGIMLFARIISALFTAIFTGWLVMFFSKKTPMRQLSTQKKSCCSSKNKIERKSIYSKFIEGQRFSFTTLLDDSFKWVLIALVFTVVLKTYVPVDFFSNYSDGILSMLIMVIISFPLYICASASTPVAAGLLLAGMSSGAVLVFILVGPASNIATISVVNKLINKRSAIVYVCGVILFSILAGIILNWSVVTFELDILAQVTKRNILHSWVAIPITIFVILCAIKPLRPFIGLVK